MGDLLKKITRDALNLIPTHKPLLDGNKLSDEKVIKSLSELSSKTITDYVKNLEEKNNKLKAKIAAAETLASRAEELETAEDLKDMCKLIGIPLTIKLILGNDSDEEFKKTLRQKIKEQIKAVEDTYAKYASNPWELREWKGRQVAFSSRGMKEEEREMRPNWEEKINAGGEVYYENTKIGATQQNRPNKEGFCLRFGKIQEESEDGARWLINTCISGERKVSVKKEHIYMQLVDCIDQEGGLFWKMSSDVCSRINILGHVTSLVGFSKKELEEIGVAYMKKACVFVFILFALIYGGKWYLARRAALQAAHSPFSFFGLS